MYWTYEIRAGTAAGTLLTVMVQLSTNDLFKTVVCAAVGAIVSFLVTLLLKRFFK